MQFSVIIVSYKVPCFLEHCLRSVQRALKNVEGEIIVIDNNSKDETFEYLSDRFEGVKFFWQESNLGFGKACNIGMNKARGDYFLILNPDTLIPEDFFEVFLKKTGKGPQPEGITGFKMIDGAGNFLPESKRGTPNGWNSFFKITGISKVFPRNAFLNEYYKGDLSKEKDQRVEVLSGACMMIPRKVFERTSGFDERYFLYGEDIDLCVTTSRKGLANRYFSEPAIIHFKGESQSGNSEYRNDFFGAMEIYIDKHYKEKSALQIGIYKLGILTAKKLSSLKWEKRDLLEENENWQLIGDERSAELLLKKYLSGANNLKIREGSISPENFTDQKFEKKEKLIFCIGQGFSMKEAIRFMERNPCKYQFRFFEEACNSIIGSDEKRESGYQWEIKSR